MMALLAVGGCDDTAFPSGVHGGGGYVADWHGVQCFLEAHCNDCHANGIGTGTFPDDIEAEIQPDFAGEAFFVVPGDPFAGTLYHSVIDQGGAAPMPLGRTEPFSPASIQHIRLWILEGATLQGPSLEEHPCDLPR